MELKRRRFLQLIGAASLAPVLPAMPVGAGAATGGSTAQMLWASMYKRAGSAEAVAAMTQTMGVSRSATQGVVTKLVQSKLVMAQGGANLGRAAHSANTVKSAPVPQVAQPPRAKVDVVKFLTEDDDVVDADQDDIDVSDTTV